MLQRHDLLLKEYELKARYLSDQFTRMWQRFHIFIVANTSLAVALFGWFREQGVFAPEARVLALTGLTLSVIWYVFGAEDRYLVEVYRRQLKAVGNALATELGLVGMGDYAVLGDVEHPRPKFALYQWRIEWLSVTKLAALFPLAVVIFWALVLASIVRPA
ncbi:MAG: RipA family octameric membrane protein [Gemmatimonadaceae bacterium]